MSITIRPAVPGDVPAILAQIRALAAYERAPDAVDATEAMLAERLFGPTPAVFAHIAEEDGVALAIAVWFLNFSTWTGRNGLYLEDLFVVPAARGRGIARRMFQALAREAVARDCPRIDWAVLAWNEDAKAAYRALGGRHMPDWEPWRIDGDALATLAKTAQSPD